MELIKGLEKYQCHPGYQSFTIPLEKRALNILNLLHVYKDTPTPSALSEARYFLIEVEKWKADCLQQRMGNAAQNSELKIWHAFQSAANATSDIERIRSIMNLKGFGSSIDDETGLRRAKVATSVLRFLWPNKWGVVDWRVVAILGLLEKNTWNVDRSLLEAKKQKAVELRKLFDIIDECAACEINEKYRDVSQNHINMFPRAADVEMAVFGLSLMAWPLPQ